MFTPRKKAARSSEKFTQLSTRCRRCWDMMSARHRTTAPGSARATRTARNHLVSRAHLQPRPHGQAAPAQSSLKHTASPQAVGRCTLSSERTKSYCNLITQGNKMKELRGFRSERQGGSPRSILTSGYGSDAGHYSVPVKDPVPIVFEQRPVCLL